MDWSWVAEIAVPLGNDEYAISTGVLVRKNLVLTAGHGIRDGQEEVELRFAVDLPKGEEGWRKAKCLEHGGDEIDVALLELEKPCEEVQPCCFMKKKPEETAVWEGSGFAAAGKEAQENLHYKRDSTGLNGRYLSGGNHYSGLLELTVEASVEDFTLWAGVSGAPVMINGKLAGVVESLNKNFAGSRFGANSMESILGFEKFKKHLPGGLDEEFLKKTQAHILRIISKKRELIRAFKKESAFETVGEDPQKIAEAILQLSVSEFTLLFFRMIRDSDSSEVRDFLEKILNVGLPALHDNEQVNSVRSGIGEGQLLQVPVSTKTCVEIVMAGVDRRPAKWRAIKDDYPVGKGEISRQAESGINCFEPDSSHADHTFQQHLENLFLSKSDRKRTDSDLKIELINQISKFKIENEFEHRFQYYCIVPEGEDEQIESIDDLRQTFKNIVFIKLKNDPKKILEERGWIEPLRMIFKNRDGDSV